MVKINNFAKNINVILFLAMFLALFVFILSLLAKRDEFFNDPGVGWHLRDGENIVANLQIPYEDTFLSVKRSWISDQWFSDIVCYVIYDLGGFKLIFLFFHFLYLSFLIVLYSILLKKKYDDFSSSLLVSIIPFAFCTMHFVFRPVFFSICLFVVFLYLFEQFKKEKESYTKINIGFFLLFLFWANIHPSFVFGFLIWGIFCLEKFFTTYKHFEYKKYFITSFLIGGATLINPYFIFLHESILFLGTNKYFMNLNEEWKSVEFSSMNGVIATAGVALIVLFFIFSRKVRQKIGITYLLSICIFYVYAMSHIRGMTYFSLVLGITLVPCISEIISMEIIKKIYILRVLPEINDKLKEIFSLKIFIIVVATFFVVAQYKVYTQFFVGPSKQKFPYKIAKYVNLRKISGNIIASPNYGGFIIWNMRDTKPVMDDRNTLLGEKAYKNFFGAFDNIKTFKKYAHNVNAEYLLVGKKDKDKMYNNVKSFSIIKKMFEDRKFVLFKIVK